MRFRIIENRTGRVLAELDNIEVAAQLLAALLHEGLTVYLTD